MKLILLVLILLLAVAMFAILSMIFGPWITIPVWAVIMGFCVVAGNAMSYL